MSRLLKNTLSLSEPLTRLGRKQATSIAFEDPRSLQLMERIALIAPSEANVLIVGETGTGKEIAARHVHALSRRAAGPFIAVNCGAFSEALIESELFGHERGAFTGALISKAGWFEAADGGTLFLDELGDLPLPLQVKLLRVLQERQVVPLGSRTPVPVDFRLLAATNVPLEQAVAAGRFRQDLYYRLKVALLELAPLRERRRDIPPLVNHFLGVYCERLGVTRPAVCAEAVELLVHQHTWPGNIRELENVVHHALLVCQNKIIRREDLNLSAAPTALGPAASRASGKCTSSLERALQSALIALFEAQPADLHEVIENCVMRTAFEYCHHNQLQTARLLGISRNIVRARLVQSGDLTPPPARSSQNAPTAECLVS